MLGTYRHQIDHLKTDETTICSFIRNGLVPSAPWTPAYAVSIRTLEIYRLTHLRSPHLAIEPFVKTLCDVYGASYQSALRDIFSVCFDLYLRLREEVEQRVAAALDRAKGWRRKNACPACTYRLKDEKKLIFSMLTTMDGNDSLKRILRRAVADLDADPEEAPTLGTERDEGRTVDPQEDYYIPRSVVDKLEDGGINPETHTKQSDNGVQDNNQEDASPCEGRWNNMSKEATSKSWGIFDETGVFVSLCRHGFVLAIVDMVWSGEA